MRRLHVLPCGYEEADKSVLTLFRDQGKKIKVPYHAYLIEDSDSTILVDTGASVDWRKLHPREIAEKWPVFMKEEERIESLLSKMGFSTLDVDYVINTHLHYDHCGNNPMFRRAAIVVHEQEFAHAMAPGWWESGSYVRAVFDRPGLKYRLVKGEHEVVPGVRAFPTQGHTEGHQSVSVSLDKAGEVILVGDAVYLRENLEGPVLPGLYVDARRYAESLEHLGSAAKRGATLMLSHSREYLAGGRWVKLKKGIQTFE